MINLLPDDRKHAIRAARANVLLLRYNFLALGVVAALAILCAGSFFILQNNKQTALATISENEGKTSILADVRKAADEYRQNLELAGKIVDNGVSYTDIVIGITKLMPDGAVLDGLSLGAVVGGGPAATTTTTQQIVFQAQSKDYATAEKLKQSFQSSPLFSNVYFQGLTDNSKDGAGGKYPVKITMSANLNVGAKATTHAK